MSGAGASRFVEGEVEEAEGEAEEAEGEVEEAEGGSSARAGSAVPVESATAATRAAAVRALR